MAEGNLNSIAFGINMGTKPSNMTVVNENARLMGEYMIPSLWKPSSIAHSTFGQRNFYLRTDEINIFQNALQFLGRATENPNTHILKFLDMCATIEHPVVSSEAIGLRFFHTH